jgi:Kef-type K+ transport system membrane component KefB/nucleotide-binding universal stress UspA family protein
MFRGYPQVGLTERRSGKAGLTPARTGKPFFGAVVAPREHLRMHAGLAAHDATVLWTQVAGLLGLAWLFGALARRLGQPPIVGFLLAGLLAGPSVFGEIWPAGFDWFRPDTPVGAGVLGAVANFALLMLLIALGAETDLRLIRRLGRPAASVVGGSLVLPLACGGLLAAVLPTSFMPPGARRTSFVLLAAAAMAVSSLPVIARISTEMRITRRNVGQLSIAAATVNDVVGFLLLALAVALMKGGGAEKLLVALGGLVVLVAALASVGQRAVDVALRRSRRGGPDVAAGFAVAAVFTFIVAATAQALGVDAALGAFLAGVVIGRSRFVALRVLDTIQSASDAVFAPLYFATAGVYVDIATLTRGAAAAWFAAIVGVAVVSKLVGVYLSARAAGQPAREATALGILLNGRGALQVILASAGLAAGILNSVAFSAIILLSLVSSIGVPPALRVALGSWAGTDEEQQRLAHEEEMTTNVVVRGQRLLLPTVGGVNSVAAARVLDLAWPEQSEVTMLLVGQQCNDAGIANVQAAFTGRRVRKQSATKGGVVAAILAEANLGYGAIGVGAVEEPHGHRLLPEFIEQLLNATPIPLVIVRRGQDLVDDGRPLTRPRRILVPVTGNAASRAGQEVAHLVSRNTGADMRLLHVVTRPPAQPDARPTRRVGRTSATAVVEEARQHAAGKDVDAEVLLREGAFSGEEIEREVDRTGADLLVVGTTVRRIGEEPFLGHTVEHLLEHVCGPTVVVVVLPEAQQAAAAEHIDRKAG